MGVAFGWSRLKPSLDASCCLHYLHRLLSESLEGNAAAFDASKSAFQPVVRATLDFRVWSAGAIETRRSRML